MASPSELERLAMSFPGVTRHNNYEVGAEYQVFGRTFVRHREPRKDAVDDAGKPLTDVIMFITLDAGTKLARVQAKNPFFTTPQFGGYNAVLLREAHLTKVSVELLEQVVTEAWVARAPKAVSTQWLAEHPNGVDPDA
jgi:hypothetical protein